MSKTRLHQKSALRKSKKTMNKNGILVNSDDSFHQDD